MVEKTASSPKAGSNSNVLAAVAYILTWVTGLIIFLVADKKDKYVRFHALQAIGLGVVFFAFYIVWQYLVVGVFLATLSAGVLALFGLVSLLVTLLLIVLIIVCAVKAYQGSKFMLPLIGAFAEKNA